VEAEQGTLEALAGIFTSTSQGARVAGRWFRIIATMAFIAILVLLFIKASPRMLSGSILTDLSLDGFTISLLAIVVVLVVTVLVQSRRVPEQTPPSTAALPPGDLKWQEPTHVAINR
jgi:hypothetical protein